MAKKDKVDTLDISSLIKSQFAYPTTDVEASKAKVFSQYLLGITPGKEMDFYKEAISLILTQTGCETSVSLDIKSQDQMCASDAGAQYSSVKNCISVSDNFFKEHKLDARSISVLAHEVYHKKQEEVNAKSKLFSAGQNNYSTPLACELLDICGFNENVFYMLRKKEQEAFEYQPQFISNFFRGVKDFALREHLDIPEFLEQEESVQSSDYANIDSRRNFQRKFISNEFNLSNFYIQAISSFEQLAEYYLKGNSASKNDRRFDTRVIRNLISLNSDEKLRPFSAISTMSQVLSVFPRRESVEQFINSVVYKGNSAEVTYAMQSIAFDRVPITESDFTKLMLAHDGKVDITSCNNEYYALNLVDEQVVAKNLVASFGVQGAREYLQQINYYRGKTSEFNKGSQLIETLDGIVSSYSPEPLLTLQDGTQALSCKDILVSIVNRETDKILARGTIRPREEIYREKFTEYSGTLANIVDNFKTISPDDKSFIDALQRFEQNPSVKQFEDRQIPTEKGSVFVDEVSESIAQVISDIRQLEKNEPEQDMVGKIESPRTEEKPFVLDSRENLLPSKNQKIVDQNSQPIIINPYLPPELMLTGALGAEKQQKVLKEHSNKTQNSDSSLDTIHELMKLYPKGGNGYKFLCLVEKYRQTGKPTVIDQDLQSGTIPNPVSTENIEMQSDKPQSEMPSANVLSEVQLEDAMGELQVRDPLNETQTGDLFSKEQLPEDLVALQNEYFMGEMQPSEMLMETSKQDNSFLEQNNPKMPSAMVQEASNDDNQDLSQ